MKLKKSVAVLALSGILSSGVAFASNENDLLASVSNGSVTAQSEGVYALNTSEMQQVEGGKLRTIGNLKSKSGNGKSLNLNSINKRI